VGTVSINAEKQRISLLKSWDLMALGFKEKIREAKKWRGKRIVRGELENICYNT